MSLEVSSYKDVSGNVVTYEGINYYLDKIPDVFNLRFDIVNEATEDKLITLIDGKTNDDKRELLKIMGCIANVLNEEIKRPKFFNEFKEHKLEMGKGMDFISENPKFFKHIIAVINIGSGVMFTLRSKVTKKMYNMWIPRRSAFIIDDEKYEYQRGIDQRPTDFVQGKEFKRKDRYSIVFRGKK